MAEVTTLGSADSFAPIIMDNVAQIRRDIPKAEADIKEAILAQSIANGHEFCDLGKTVLTDGSLTRLNLANAERDLQNRIHETRIEALKTNTDLSRYLADKTDSVKDRMTAFERNVDLQFCDIKSENFKNTQKIIDSIASNKYDAIKDKLDETRLECSNMKFSNNFALQNQEVANLKNMINSIEQTQRFSSKTVQFGAGNVAIPTQTANQG